MHIDLDDRLVAEIDKITGPRGRSDFVRRAIGEAVSAANRRDHLSAAAGSIPDHGHEWDDDPAAWVRAQRRGDPRRVG
jgi:Arc/MetJ family transcription regulator